MHSTRFAYLKGHVSYPQPITLLPGTTLTVELLDTTLEDGAYVTLASHCMRVGGEIPLHYCLTLDRALLHPGHTYQISASIRLEPHLLMYTTEPQHVELDPLPSTDVDVLVR